MALDVVKLLAEVSPEQPCGESLEYDPACMELMRLAGGTPPREEMAGQSVEGEEPNWSEIRSQAIDLFGRTHDLAIAFVLLAAETAQNGIPGLRDSLELLKKMLTQHWDHLHPQLDPDDDNDPSERLNVIAALAVTPGSEWNPTNPQRRMRLAPIAKSRQLGTFGLRDMMMASGELASPGGSPPDPALIEGAMSDTPAEDLSEIGDAATACIELSKEIDDWLTEKVGAGSAADLSGWHSALTDLNGRVQEQLARRGLGAAETAEESDAAAAASGGAVQSGPAEPALTGAIRNRDEVMLALGKILEYYARSEPSSPVPMLIRRTQRLVTMSFPDIIKELSPNAMDQIKLIGGDEAFRAEPPPASPGSPSAAPAPPAGDPSPPGEFGEPQKLQF